MNTNADPEHAECSKSPATLVQRLRSHIAQMAPHQKEREAGRLLVDALAALSAPFGVHGTPDTPAPTVPVERYIAAMDAAEMLWTLVANVRDWKEQSDEWQSAAPCYRNAYFKLIHGDRPLVPAPVRGASAVDAPPVPTPPADAPEPPWVVAADEIAPPTERLRYGDQFRARRIAIIERACRAHAAALAQERDALRAELDEAEKTEFALEDSIAEARATVARLTAERDRLRAALERLLKFTDELCHDVGVSTNYPSAQAARSALSGAQGAPEQLARAALAPTQKEEA